MPSHSKLKDSQRSLLQHQRHVTKLEKEIKYAQTDDEKAKIYDKFAENFLMPKELWIKRLRFVSDKEMDGYKEVFSRRLMNKTTIAEQIQVWVNAMQHLYYDREAINCKSLHLKMLKPSCVGGELPGNADTMLVNKDVVNKTLKNLSYPNNRLRHNLMLYERYSSSPAPKSLIEKVEKMETLYWKIKAVSGNLEKWIKTMAEANDIEFVKHNVEHKLGNNLTNKKLWRLYIDYLRKVDPKEMLQVYSKYCRYFLEDIKMKEEYQRETEKNKDTVFVGWNNPFDFEAVEPVTIQLDELPPKEFPCLSEVIRDKIYQCDARFIDICDQEISVKEFKFLVGHGMVEKIELWDCEIKKENGDLMMVEEILALLPNVRSFNLHNSLLTTTNTLSKLHFFNKILKFHLFFIQNNLDATDFCTFIKTNAAPFSKFEITFDVTSDAAMATNIQQSVELLLKQWKPVDEMPNISIEKSL
uniref:Uncharacterized protein n=1 Tax=Panagrolaimus sp. ES5 TaxID=591445 RepID=A0AC34FI76_9BILA